MATSKQSTKAAALTSKQLQHKVFGVSDTTLLAWRNPREGASKTKLPCKVKDGRVSFDPKRVKAWANKNGVKLLADPEKVARQGA
jgi:hypothetical protein